MDTSDKHIIHKLFVEVETNDRERAMFFKDHLDQFLKEEILKVLAQHIDEANESMPYHVLQLDQLSLELNFEKIASKAQIREAIAKQFKTQLTEVLTQFDQNNTKEGIKGMSKEESQLRSFLDFLETGIEPWYRPEETGVLHLIEDVIKAPRTTISKGRIIRTLRSKVAFERLIHQFSKKDVYSLFKYLSEDKELFAKLFPEEQVAKFEYGRPALRKTLWRTVFQVVENDETNTFKSLFSSELNASTRLQGLSENETNIVQMLDEQIARQLGIDFSAYKNSLDDRSKRSIAEKTKIDPSSTQDSNIQQEEHPTASDLKAPVINQDKSDALKEDHSKEKDRERDSKEIEPRDDKYLAEKGSVQEKEEIENDVLFNTSNSNDDELLTSNTKKGHAPTTQDNGTRDISETSEQEGKERLKSEPQSHQDTDFSERDFQDAPLHTEKGTYYVYNAGLLLLHPFLSAFFEDCELMTDKKFTDPVLAIHLLHYVATGKEQEPENLMAMEKFLCNIPVSISIDRFIELPDNLKQKADELLSSTLSHWQILKSSTKDLLQNEFLQRPGKLILKDQNPKIIMERKTQDILLNQLPWNHSLFKLPWKDQLIFVDW
ncbi:contractile injection system tape measure protein [Sungkyunkwania multivorans]|uniref:Contractile injection system tape measure protein n=1 Tax=Sungkyunkwania multivorans TaxID=1173618 RepID=A0ABW3CVM0_9FLAO